MIVGAFIIRSARRFFAWLIPVIFNVLVFVLAGFVLTYGLVAAGLPYLIAPLIAGFMLVGPALTLGFHAISRDLEQGRKPSLRRALVDLDS